MRDSYQAVSRLSIMAALPIFCCLFLFSSEILSIFGSEFVDGRWALMILALGQVFNTATGSANTVLLMSGQSRLVMRNTVVMGVVLLATTAMIIPFWGITGAALAAATIFILTNVIRVSQVWRLHHVQPYSTDLAKSVTAAVVATGIALMLSKLAPSLSSPVVAFAFGMLYLAGIWLLGVSRQDRLIFESLVSRGKSIFEKG